MSHSLSLPVSLSPARTARAALRATRARLPDPSVEKLRVAVAALFVLDGVVFGSWAARVPGVAAQVGATHSALGVALLCLSIGALACMRSTGRWSARFGSGPVAAAAGIAVCATAVLPGLAGSVPALCVALLLFGAATGMVNVAANALGVEVEARTGRPLLSSLHAGFSIGGLAGALLGGAAAAVLGVAAHLALVAAGGLALMASLLPVLLAAPRARVRAAPTGDDAGRRPRGATAALVVLGIVAGCTAFGEGALTDWGALLLREERGATVTLGALGYAGFASAMACGRLAGSRLLLALGERRLLVGGGVLAAGGGLLAVFAPALEFALTGFVLVGLGLANVFPLAIARAGTIGGASGIALASTVGYTGLLGGPPAIGFLAEHLGLPLALSSLSLLALLAAGLSTTVAGTTVRIPPAPPALTRVGARLQPVVAGFGHGTGVYVRELGVLRLDGR
jgi:MFS family permease